MSNYLGQFKVRTNQERKLAEYGLKKGSIIAGPSENTQHILTYINKSQRRRISNKQITRLTGLSAAQISRHINYLLVNEYIDIYGKTKHSRKYKVLNPLLTSGVSILDKPRNPKKLETYEQAALEYIKENQNKALKQKDIAKALDSKLTQSDASIITRRLIEKGLISRQMGPGKVYSYMVNGEVKTSKLPEYKPKTSRLNKELELAETELSKKINSYFISFANSDSDNLVGANEFRKFINEQEKQK